MTERKGLKPSKTTKMLALGCLNWVSVSPIWKPFLLRQAVLDGANNEKHDDFFVLLGSVLLHMCQTTLCPLRCLPANLYMPVITPVCHSLASVMMICSVHKQTVVLAAAWDRTSWYQKVGGRSCPSQLIHGFLLNWESSSGTISGSPLATNTSLQNHKRE